VYKRQEAGLRALSALAGILAVPVAYAIGRRLGGRGAGLATAALVAVNPLLVWFSQEARSYALVALLSATALLLFLRCREEDRRAWPLAAWAAVAILALATHYFAAFVLAPQAAWLLWRHPRRGAAAAAVGALAAVGAALLPLLLAQRGNPYEIVGQPLPERLAQVSKQFLLGYRGPLALPLALAGAALVLAGAWLLLRRTGWREREAALGVAGIGAAGVALPLLAALLGTDYLNARNLLPALVPLLAALGVAYGAPRATAAGPAALAALCAISLAIVVAVAADREYQRPDWGGLADALGPAEGPRALVVSPANGLLALRYYRAGIEPMGREGARVEELDVVTVASAARPGDEPAIPPLVGALAVPGLAKAGGEATATYAIVRYRPASGRTAPVVPDPLGALRFGERFPAVAVLR